MSGGADRIRTGVEGFQGLCIAALPPRQPPCPSSQSGTGAFFFSFACKSRRKFAFCRLSRTPTRNSRLRPTVNDATRTVKPPWGRTMQTLREFITTRQTEIRTQIAALRAEDQELRIALAAIDTDASPSAPRSSNRGRVSRQTIKDKIVEVLRAHPEGGTAEAIIEWVQQTHGTEIPRNSLSPQLSRLKQDGAVIRDDESKKWRLIETEQSPEGNAPPEGGADAGEDCPLSDRAPERPGGTSGLSALW